MTKEAKVEVPSRKNRPECMKTNGFLVCYCGDCKSEDYPLPKDFSVLADLLVKE